jgi:uncharacterized protein YdhG (YjbR/CyaY superfamily)
VPPPTPGVTDDERRTIAEMMAKGTYGPEIFGGVQVRGLKSLAGAGHGAGAGFGRRFLAGQGRTRESLQREGTMSAKKATQKSAGFTDEERAAMKNRAQELKAEARRGPRADKADGERDVLAKIAEMPAPDRAMGERLHAVIKASAPALSPKLWYGMPAYAKDGKVVCFFQAAQKFNSRYATFGFNDSANLDEGAMWPTSFALKELTAADEAKIAALVKKAVS